MRPSHLARAVAWGLVLWALIALAFLLGCQAARAVPMGVQDDGLSSAAVAASVAAMGGQWTRTIVYVGQPSAAQRIRDAHADGLRIILTVGGTGTRTRHPTARDALAYIRSLPRADRYTFVNEPDLSGMEPCSYRWRWMRLRRSLGARLLYGDFSPHRLITYSFAVRSCGRLPHRLGVAVHPYQPNDPLAHSDVPDWFEGGIGNLRHAGRMLRAIGVRATWWLDEFGYGNFDKAAWQTGDAQAAWLWPRAVEQARRLRAAVLIAYTAQGPSWDTRPRPLTWCAMTRGRVCPSEAPTPEGHREPPRLPRPEAHVDSTVEHMLAYAKAGS